MGFRKFITNLLFRKSIEEDFEKLEEIRPPDNPSRKYIDKLVERLLKDHHSWTARRELEMIGASAVPSLTAALDDKRYHQEKRDSLDDPALQMVLELLIPHAPDTVLSTVLTLQDSSSAEDRQLAALQTASLGRDDTVPILAKLLTDSDGYVRAYVNMGVKRALDAGRRSPGFRVSMYELLLAQCDQHWGDAVNDAADTVIQLDATRAAADFAKERWLSNSNPYLYKILEACNGAGILLPEALVRRLFDESMPLAAGESCDPHQYVAAASLYALALRMGEGARPLIEKALSSDQEDIQEAAGKALAKLAGLTDAFTFVLKQKELRGLAGLTRPQQAIYCCWIFDAELVNGGLMQFFANSSGDYAPETLTALQEMGHPPAENALAMAMKVIGKASRNRDRDRRLAAFEDRYDDLQRAFKPLEDAHYKTRGIFLQRMHLYTVAHADHFRAE